MHKKQKALRLLAAFACTSLSGSLDLRTVHSFASEFDRQIRSQHHSHVVLTYPNAGRIAVFVDRMEITGERKIP